MTPIERMARAICREEHILRFGEEIWRSGELDRKVDAYWRQHVPAARAALAAIEEPSETMIAAPYSGELSKRFIVKVIWRSMIRAALEEGP